MYCRKKHDDTFYILDTAIEVKELLEELAEYFGPDFAGADVVIIPPDVGEWTEKEINDSQPLLSDTDQLEIDIESTHEIDLFFKHGTEAELQTFDEPNGPTSGSQISANETPKWKTMKPTFQTLPENHEKHFLQLLKDRYGSCSATDIATLFIDDSLLSLLVEFTTKHARDKNNHLFSITKTEMRKFIGILLLTGCHWLPKSKLYWSNDKGIPIVPLFQRTMSRERFKEIKKFLHLSDSAKLDRSDKFSTVRPFFDELNKIFIQFGVFSHRLSIDKQIVPYSGPVRIPYFKPHSTRLLIHGRPVAVGFRLWCLASSDGYMYQFMPYAGGSEEDEGLGERVVLQLLDSISINPKDHEIYFDRFFSSYNLMRLLTDKGFYAAGTVKETRLMGCDLLRSTKVMRESQKGDYDCVVDTKKNIAVTRWRNNRSRGAARVVTLISNFSGPEPISSDKDFSQRSRMRVMLPVPGVVQKYDEGVRGVALNRSEIVDLRISVQCKKWWWPLFVNGIDCALVNAWKLFCLATNSKTCQLDFKSAVAQYFMQTELEQAKNDESVLAKDEPAAKR